MRKTLSSFFSLADNVTKLPKKAQLLFVIGTLFTASCSSELELTDDVMTIETDYTIKTVSSKDAINILNNQTLNSKSIFKNVESTSSLNFVYQEKITNSNQLLTIIPNNENKNGKYVFLNINGKIETSIITTFPENPNTDSEFSGKIIIQRLDGSFVNGFRFKNGFITSRLEKKPTSSLTSKNTDPNPTELSEVIIPPRRKEYFTIVYIYYPYGDRANRGDLPESLMWDPTGGGGYSGDEPATEESIAQAIEDQIDDSQLDPCTKGVLDKLKNLTQNDIAKIFEKFGVPVNGTYNIQMVLGTPIANDALADTKTVSKNNYIITIRDTYIQGTYNNQNPPTDLAVAAVIIHELIHAHFLGLFDDYHNNGDTCAYDNYNCLYEKYVTKNFTGDTDAQHTQMFKSYIDIMSSALQEFHPGLSSQYYNDLAMSTMYGLKYFDNKYPIGSIERTRIENTRLAEDRNTPKGTATPKGTPCN